MILKPESILLDCPFRKHILLIVWGMEERVL